VEECDEVEGEEVLYQIQGIVSFAAPASGFELEVEVESDQGHALILAGHTDLLDEAVD
jgi:hypothetical protein